MLECKKSFHVVLAALGNSFWSNETYEKCSLEGQLRIVLPAIKRMEIVSQQELKNRISPLVTLKKLNAVRMQLIPNYSTIPFVLLPTGVLSYLVTLYSTTQSALVIYPVWLYWPQTWIVRLTLLVIQDACYDKPKECHILIWWKAYILV